ncbi:MAG: hypothetical protein PHF29_04850 [Candidatus Riflebacteria bacterium]|nr:hypothetical protein [Candidatus Riflebacteria bacterium]
MLNANTKKKSTFIKLAVSGIGCFIIYPAILLVIVAIIGFLVFSYPYKAFSSAVLLPELELPSDDDFWKLQEKELDTEVENSGDLLLSFAEYNAYLNRVNVPPCCGYALQRVRFTRENSEPVFYLAGSGFMQKILNIRIEFNKDSNSSIPKVVSYNKFRVPQSGISKKISDMFLTKLFECGGEKSINKIIAANLPEISGDTVKIKRLSALKK